VQLEKPILTHHPINNNSRNHAELSLVRRSEMGTRATDEELEKAKAVGSENWEEILPMSQLAPG
jgi:hypothetical protein